MQKRSSLFISFLFFLILSLVLLGTQQVFPMKQGLSLLEQVLAPLERITYAASAAYETPQTQTQTLEKKIADLQQQIFQLKSDNAAFRDQFATVSLPAKKLLPAHIIGMPRFVPGISQPDELTIDVGSDEGVKNHTVVVIQNMLVGKITNVLPHIATVSLTTNPSISFTANDVQSGALGIVRGMGNGQIGFGNVVLSDTVSLHDAIVTKGDIAANGEGFPPGLLVGTVTNINKSPSALFQTASLQQPFAITHETMVFLLSTP